MFDFFVDFCIRELPPRTYITKNEFSACFRLFTFNCMYIEHVIWCNASITPKRMTCRNYSKITSNRKLGSSQFSAIRFCTFFKYKISLIR